jgi:hypothetical protein
LLHWEFENFEEQRTAAGLFAGFAEVQFFRRYEALLNDSEGHRENGVTARAVTEVRLLVNRPLVFRVKAQST